MLKPVELKLLIHKVEVEDVSATEFESLVGTAAHTYFSEEH